MCIVIIIVENYRPIRHRAASLPTGLSPAGPSLLSISSLMVFFGATSSYCRGHGRTHTVAGGASRADNADERKYPAAGSLADNRRRRRRGSKRIRRRALAAVNYCSDVGRVGECAKNCKNKYK